MRYLLSVSLTLFAGCNPYVCAQTPAGKEATPPAKKEPAATPAAQPSRETVEKYVKDLKAFIATRESSMTRLVNEITTYDQSINAAVEQVLEILTTAKDSVETRSKVTQMKQDTMAALKRAAQAYAQKRGLIAEELRTTKNEFRREDLFNSRGQIDTRIDSMVNAMLKLALSMETDEGHERYVQDSSIMVGGGRYGISVPATARNPEYDQNKRQAARTNKVGTEIDKAFDSSLQRLDIQARDLTAKLAKPEISAEEKTRLEAELQRIQAIQEDRRQQQALFEEGPQPGLQMELDRKEVGQTEELVESITAGARRDFTRMMAAFNELRSERQALATQKAKLDHAVKWLESPPPAK